MANPRIDELKRRIEREPGSRLFAQLAEELRKDGDLPEAIRVARAGLQAHPNYPSARLTLGRSLFESGQLAAARTELEGVLRGAPDNILAARMLAECLEGLDDGGAALLQYRAALRLSPGDRQLETHVRALEQRLGGTGAPRPPSGVPPAEASGAGAAPRARPPVPEPRSGPPSRPLGAAPAQAEAVRPSPVAAPAPALPVGPAPRAPARPAAVPQAAAAALDPAPDFEDVFEPGPAWKSPAPSAPSAAGEAILLLEDEAPTLPGAPAFARPPLRPSPAVESTPGPGVDLAAAPPPPFSPDPHTAASAETLAGAPAFSTSPRLGSEGESKDAHAPGYEAAPSSILPEAQLPASASLPEPSPPEASPPEPSPPEPSPLEPSPPEASPALSTPTIAEIYFDQGLYTRAVEVYEEILEREPANERARARLVEVRALARTLDVPPAPDPRAERRQAIERTISKLEQMLAAVRRG